MASGKIRDRDWVAQQLDAGATVAELAERAGVARQTAYNWIARHRLLVRPTTTQRPNKTRLRTMYRELESIAAVARVLNVASGTAYRWLIDADVKPAPPGPRKRLSSRSEMADLRRQRHAGATLAQLAAHFGISRETVRRRLREQDEL